MPHSVLIVLGIESVLVFMTAFFLVQPDVLFRLASQKIRTVVRWSGMLLLCLTFCWSVIVGIILSLNGLSLKI